MFVIKFLQMLKRLSYPLSWVEGLTGDGTGNQSSQGSQGSQGDSLPTSADSHNSTSVFSKVFNRSVCDMFKVGWFWLTHNLMSDLITTKRVYDYTLCGDGMEQSLARTHPPKWNVQRVLPMCLKSHFMYMK